MNGKEKERMETKLEKITIRSPKICNRLLEYAHKVMSYDNFDKSMLCRVYVDDTCDFIAFESVQYGVQFTSNYKKLISIKTSVYEPITCTFSDFVRHVQAIEPLPME